MMGSTQALAVFDPIKHAGDQLSTDPFLDPFPDPRQNELIRGSGSTRLPLLILRIYILNLLILDPQLQALSRDQCADGKWGSYLPHTSHHRVPLASEYPGLPSSPLIRAASANRETRNDEGKTKMSTIRDVVEMAFAAGHAAGMVDATDERQAEVPIGDLRTEWFVNLDRLARDAEQMLGKGQ